MSNSDVIDAKIIANEKNFVKMVRRCDTYSNSPEIPSFPCAVQVTHHDGMGHCGDWYTHGTIEPPKNYSKKEKAIYLKGVITGWGW